jgi:exosome complex component RRP42
MTSLFSTSELSFVSVPLSTSSAPATSVDPLLRADGRLPLAYRDILLATNVSQAQGALGSAKVQIGSTGGETEIWAGVRGEVEDVTDHGEEQQQERGEQGGRIVVSIEW